MTFTYRLPIYLALAGIVAGGLLDLACPLTADPEAAQCEAPRHVREVMRATHFIDSTNHRCFVNFYPADDSGLDEFPAESVQIACD